MTGTIKVDTLKAAPGQSRLILENMQSGYILSTSSIRNNVRTAVSGTPRNLNLFGGNFTKHRDDTVIIATATIFGEAFQSGNCAVGLALDEQWDYGLAYQYDGQWGAYQTTIIAGTCRWTGIKAGTHYMSFGWNTINYSANERPFGFLNPNSSTPSEPRNQQMISSILIYEVYP